MRQMAALFGILMVLGCGSSGSKPKAAAPTPLPGQAPTDDSLKAGAPAVGAPGDACAKATGKTEGCSYWAESGGKKYCFDLPEDACMCQCGKAECTRTEAAMDNTVSCN